MQQRRRWVSFRSLTKYNKREYVDPDPLLFLYDYPDKKDREIAGLVAACFAYGRVEMIMKTVGSVLAVMHPSPFAYLKKTTKKRIREDFKGFRYRFATQDHLVNLLWGIRGVIKEFSSLEKCFHAGVTPEDETIIGGMRFLSRKIRGNRTIGHLLADPEKKSACKRSLLFLRWMVRKDGVDPGGWAKISPSLLLVPLDTHMYKTGVMFGFTTRKSRDMKTALEITRGFRRINKADPVKYDFCLTRFGIRKEFDMDDLKRFMEA